MIYIHDSQLEFHGNLKSSNCVVTSRWMLQVTDFGLHDLRTSAESESIGEHQHYRSEFLKNIQTKSIFKTPQILGLLWKAPELLRNPNICGTQKGDVYAFAIILYEVISRRGPFGQIGYEPKEIVDLVRRIPNTGDIPFRPDLKSLADESYIAADYIVNTIRDSWDEEPENRPDFPTIR